MTRPFLCAFAVALALPALAFAFPNTEPLAAQQWYLDQDRAWGFWPQEPTLTPIKVAVIDSGIDYGHPEFAGRIAAGRSFVGGTWQRDTDGHGTFVAGLIAADPANNQGIAGLAFNAQLLIAKVVEADGNVNLQGEVAAIKWAVAQGARVINLSLGGERDPQDPRNDYFSPAERNAVAYAVAGDGRRWQEMTGEGRGWAEIGEMAGEGRRWAEMALDISGHLWPSPVISAYLRPSPVIFA